MDFVEFEKLKKELRLIAFPRRPRPLKHCGNRDGVKVYLRKRCFTYWDLLKKYPPPIIGIEPPKKIRGTRYANRMTCLLIAKLWDYICDRLFG